MNRKLSHAMLTDTLPIVGLKANFKNTNYYGHAKFQLNADYPLGNKYI